MNLSMTLRAVALRLPHRPALTSEHGSMTYAAFEQAVGRLAAGLRHGLQLPAGARVGIALENCPEFMIVLYAAWRAGLAAVPMNAKLHPKEMAFILSDSGCGVCFASASIAEGLQARGGPGLPPIEVVSGGVDKGLLSKEPLTHAPGDADAEAWLFYTSGTTGRPKGAVLTHRNLMFMCHAYYADMDQLDERDVMLHAAPLSHGSGLYGLAHIAQGSHQLILSAFDPAEIHALLLRHRAVSMFAAPTMVTRLVNHPAAGTAPPEHLKTLIFGGAPMYVEDLKQALALFGPRLSQLYGQGESPMTITSMPKRALADSGGGDWEARLASAGFARTGVEVMVVDEEGRALPPGKVGEVITRSDCVMRGYWNNAEANARALRQGWLWTGDLGSLDAQGHLTLKDRSKDLIISGGSNIYPREIEEVLLMHPAVLECAVASRPHKDWGEEVVAFVALRPGHDASDADLDALCLANIARFKRPKAYVRVAALPKNSYGKVLKTELRAMLARGSDGSP